MKIIAPTFRPITKPQIRRFWNAFRPAWTAHAGRTSLDPSDRAASEAWRHALLREECHGATSLKDLDNASFDALMLRLAVETGDESAMARYSAGDERRLRWLIRQKLTDLDRLDPGRPHGIPYLLGILRQTRLRGPAYSLRTSPATLDDFPADHLRTALQILDTRLRRLRDRRAPIPDPIPF